MRYTKQTQQYFDALQEMNIVNAGISNAGKLTKSELALITTIGKYMDCHNGVKSSDLSHKLNVTTAAISKMLRVLEKKGLIERSNDEKDRRVVYVRLTYAGNDAFLESMGEREDLLENVFRKMGPQDVDTFLTLWTVFNKHMEAEYKKMKAETKRGRDMMNTVFIESPDLHFTAADILEKMGMPRDHKFGEKIAEFLKKAEVIAKPKAFYMKMKIEKRTEDSVTIGGQTFQSIALAKNLTNVDTVYPYLCTCGSELAEYAIGLDDILEQYAFDAIMEMYRKEVLVAMMGVLSDSLEEVGQTSAVNPGSLIDWPISEQQKLFAVFGENAEKIGVTLSDSCIMSPIKSVSGIRYQTDKAFHNCQLCQKKVCPDREDPFNRELYCRTMQE